MPEEYKIPEAYQCFDRKVTSIKQISSSIAHIREPKPFIETLSFDIPFYDSCIRNPHNSYFPSNNIELNVEGPINEKRGIKKLIIYKIDKLIQHNPEKDLKPFWIWLGNTNSNTRWEIPVRITCEELHEPTFDTIFIDIKIIE